MDCQRSQRPVDGWRRGKTRRLLYGVDLGAERARTSKRARHQQHFADLKIAVRAFLLNERLSSVSEHNECVAALRHLN